MKVGVFSRMFREPALCGWLVVFTLSMACSSGNSGASPLPVINSFIATPDQITAGETSTLSWNVTGAVSIAISPGVTISQGASSVEVTPTENTTFVLTATNSEGKTVTAVRAVSVLTDCVPGAGYTFSEGPTYIIPGTSTTGTLPRTIPWKPGVPGGIPVRNGQSDICATIDPNGTDDAQAINNALANCPDGKVVKLKAGTYHVINDSIVFAKSNVTLRGAGGPGIADDTKRTVIVAGANLAGSVIRIATGKWTRLNDAGEDPSHEAFLAEVALSGTNTLKLETGTASRFAVGEVVILDQETSPENDTMFSPWTGVDAGNVTYDELMRLTGETYQLWPLDLANDGSLTVKFPYAMFDGDMPPQSDLRHNNRRFNRPIAQVVEISKVDTVIDTLTLNSPLHMTFAPALKAQVGASNGPGVEGCGVEDLVVSSVPPAESNNNRGSGIDFSGAKRSWVRNVEFDHINVNLSNSYQCTVRDSYVHEVHGLPSPGGGGYGVQLERGSSDNLIENNVVWNFDKVMVAPGAGPGNVFAYNYMDDGWIWYQPNWVESGMEASHGATPFYELFEGNLTFNLGSDPTHGNNIFMTWLRNLSTIHRSGWPPLNSYRVAQQGNDTVQSNCIPAPHYDEECVAYIDVGNRSGAQAYFGDYFFSYLGNVLGSDDTPLDPQAGTEDGQFLFDTSDSSKRGVPMWDLGWFSFEGRLPEKIDANVTKTLLRDGNYDIVTKTANWDSPTVQPIPRSLYLCGKPAFFGTYTWPWVDGSDANAPYLGRSYLFYPLKEGLGAFVTPDLDPNATPTTTYRGYQLPAFIRFLKLREIEGQLSDCASSSVAAPSIECSLLLTGMAP